MSEYINKRKQPPLSAMARFFKTDWISIRGYLGNVQQDVQIIANQLLSKLKIKLARQYTYSGLTDGNVYV